MTRFTPSRFLMIAAVAAALFAGIAPSAKAESLRSTPQLFVGSTYCSGFGYDGAYPVSASYSILAANLYPNHVEGQQVYVRTAIHQYIAGDWAYVATGAWFYGRAFDHIGPQQWLRFSDNLILGGGGWVDSWTVRGHGHFRIAVEFAWDTSSTGAPSGRSGWLWTSGYCTT